MKKKLIILSVILLTIVLLVGGIIIYPNIKKKMEYNKMKEEIIAINNYLEKNTGNYSEIKKILDDDIFSNERKNLEDGIEKYLNDLLTYYDILNNIKSDDKVNNLNISDINNETSNYLNEIKTKLEETNNSLNNVISNKNNYINTTNDELKKEYSELLDINLNYNDIIDELENKIDSKNKIIDFLVKNKDKWKTNDNTITFLKRNSFNEYEKINNNILNYSLIKDTTSPKITASNITIYKGNSVDVKSKVKCMDDVDDKVDCKIEGKYDNKKIGTYNIKITATDKSNNTSNKTIKLIVKEKPSNKKPYYIEVIRNHNIVIVYGLDSNNEYKKIVKVFTCSVGLNGKTPTGTFKTSDKSKWGSLVGGVYGQYYTRIKGNILFHSVPYFKRDKGKLEWEEYNKLGTAASKGCVRLAVRDVKWIFDNCPTGTTVKIYDGNIPSGVNKPSAIKISNDSPNKGWDPTDPDKNNPWKK